MATVTPNFNWPVPTSTDLVKDGATAIEALGDSIDASLVDLKGGTTGQVLSKNSNTDMDFTWVTDAAGDITGVTAGTGISGGGTSGTVTVTNSMATAIDAKGDLVPGTGADTFARLAVGANGTVLTADSAEATGLKWVAPASGSGLTLIAAQTVTSSSTVSVNSVFSGTYQNYTVYFQLIGAGGAQDDLRMRVGGADNSNASTYIVQKLDVSNTTVTGSRVTSNLFDNVFLTSAANAINRINFYQPFEAEQTAVEFTSGINGEEMKFAFGRQTNNTSFDGFSLLFAGAVSGTVWIYGWKETV